MTEGYCVVLGLTDGALVTELLRQSRLKLIAIDEDAATVRAVRGKLAAADLLGERVSVHVGDPQDGLLATMQRIEERLQRRGSKS